MIFSSPWFVAFLAVTLLLLAADIGAVRKKRLLAVLSCLFYAAWDYRYVALLLCISAIDFVCASRIHSATTRRRSRSWLLISMSTNLGLLAYFKYANFFIATANHFLVGEAQIAALNVLLPAGISFYTFKTMSYVIDVYRSEIEPVASVLDYVMFVTFFPELIAGPIVRASVFLPQMSRPIGPSRERMTLGCSAFLLGFTKKLMADRLGILAQPVFAAPHFYDRSSLAAAVLAYSLQIYCDFSGYSDMAIGTAKMIGYDLPENFNMPYLSRDLSEFWRRWHITLSSWLRDYLYIPLGGNRHGGARTYFNLFVTMLLGGLWHGASWTFVLWGVLHGAGLALHRSYRALVPRRFGMPTVLAVPVTFAFVALCWIPFRCTTFAATSEFLHGLLGYAAGNVHRIAPDLWVVVAVVVLGHVMGIVLSRQPGSAVRWMLGFFDAKRIENRIAGTYVQLGWTGLPGAYVTLTWVLLAFLLFLRSNSPFLYFQF